MKRHGEPPGSSAPTKTRDREVAAAPQADRELAELAKALGHPARVHIVRLLAQRDGCICGEIVEVLDLAQSTVSQHLKVLKGAGLVQGEVDGPRVCYCLDRAALRRLEALVGGLACCRDEPHLSKTREGER